MRRAPGPSPSRAGPARRAATHRWNCESGAVRDGCSGRGGRRRDGSSARAGRNREPAGESRVGCGGRGGRASVRAWLRSGFGNLDPDARAIGMHRCLRPKGRFAGREPLGLRLAAASRPAWSGSILYFVDAHPDPMRGQGPIIGSSRETRPAGRGGRRRWRFSRSQRWELRYSRIWSAAASAESSPVATVTSACSGGS